MLRRVEWNTVSGTEVGGSFSRCNLPKLRHYWCSPTAVRCGTAIFIGSEDGLNEDDGLLIRARRPLHWTRAVGGSDCTRIREPLNPSSNAPPNNTSRSQLHLYHCASQANQHGTATPEKRPWHSLRRSLQNKTIFPTTYKLLQSFFSFHLQFSALLIATLRLCIKVKKHLA